MTNWKPNTKPRATTRDDRDNPRWIVDLSPESAKRIAAAIERYLRIMDSPRRTRSVFQSRPDEAPQMDEWVPTLRIGLAKLRAAIAESRDIVRFNGMRTSLNVFANACLFMFEPAGADLVAQMSAQQFPRKDL